LVRVNDRVRVRVRVRDWSGLGKGLRIGLEIRSCSGDRVRSFNDFCLTNDRNMYMYASDQI